MTLTVDAAAGDTSPTVPPSQASRITRGLGWSMVSSLSLRVGNLLVGILMARLIAPEQFGVFAVALTVWNILGALAEFGLGSDLVRCDDVERRAPTVATLALGTSGVLALSMALAAGPIAASFRSPESESVIRLMAISVAVFGLTVVPSALLQRAFRQRAVFLANGAGVLASATVMTVLAVQGAGPAALAWGQVASQVGTLAVLLVVTGRRPSFGFDREIAIDSLAFCGPLAFANLLSWVLLSVDNLVVARVLGPAELGLYVLAFNISSWPMNAIGQAIRVVALPAFAQVGDRAERNAGLVRSVGPTAAVAALAALGLATLATPVITILYGERWHGAAAALAGLAVFGGVRVVLDLVATFLIAAGATRAILATQVGWLLAMVPAMAVSVSVFGLAGAGWAHLVVAIVVVLPLYCVFLRRAGVDVAGFLRGAGFPFLAAVPAAVVCTWIGTSGRAPWLLVLVGSAAIVFTYVMPLSRWWLASIDLLRRSPASVLKES